MIIDRNASVVEYNSARVLLVSKFGYALYRKSDSNLIAMEDPDNMTWIDPNKDTDAEIVMTLNVDQGSFTQTLDLYTGKLRFSYPAEELVDFLALLKLIVRRLNPDFESEPSPFTGRGKSMTWHINSYFDEMKKHEQSLTEKGIKLV